MTLLTRTMALFICVVALSGCESATSLKQWAFTPSTPKPTHKIVGGVPVHESWCYRTMGQPDCYSEPQNVHPESLIGVDPPSRRPLTNEEYAKALAAVQPTSPNPGPSDADMMPAAPQQDLHNPIDLTPK